MGRPQVFNEDAVVAKAMEMFWEKGFEGTSTRDLIEGTGISNGSFFNSFGDKTRLYVKCLQKYDTLYIDPLVKLLNAPLPFRQKIRKVLTQATKTSAKNEGYEGCLVFNTTIDKGVRDAGIASLATSINKRIGDALELAIDQAKSRGEITGPIKTRYLAQYLFNIINGLRVLLLQNPPKPEVKHIVDSTIELLPQ